MCDVKRVQLNRLGVGGDGLVGRGEAVTDDAK